MSSKIRVRDMPKIRDELVRHEQSAPRDTDPATSGFYLRGLRKASLWWVSQDMTELVKESFQHLPEWTPAIAAPEPEGLIVWDGDPYHFGFPKTRAPEFFFANKQGGEAVAPEDYGLKSYLFPLRAAYWSFAKSQCRVTVFTDAIHALHPRGHLEEFITFDFHATLPFSQSDVNINVLERRAMQILGASWLLMQQPTIADAKRVVPRTGRRKSSPDAPPSVNDVQIIDLRRLATKRSEAPSHEEGREYHVRWLVRGHWRQQACGPGRKFRKPVFVAPHIRGPEGAPLKTERVNVWRR